MNLREVRQVIDTQGADVDASRVFGQPYETADGATVIPVLRPPGVFVVKDGKSIFTPAVNGERLAMMGILVGLISAALAGLAMVRRPPWPDLRGDISRH
jgi:hypothetical protein